MPPKNRRHNANLKERRHENGLARPGKQIKKQKSDPHINGHAPSASNHSGVAPAPNAQSVTFHPPLPHATGDFSLENALDGSDCDFVPSQSVLASSTGCHQDPQIPPPSLDTMAGEKWLDSGAESQHLTVLGRPDPSHKGEMSPNTAGNLSNATVIRPRSVRDVVAILLLLLQLPPTILTVIHFVFAFLTFGSVSAGWSVSSVASTPGWLQSHGGNPSVVTTFLTDIVFLIAWILLPYGKDFTLDLSQAVVAISLAGGATGRSGRTHSGVCMTIIILYHGLQSAHFRTRVASLFWALTSRYEALDAFDLEPYIPSIGISPLFGRSWPRTIVELHIVTQGFVRIVRRSYFLSTASTSSPERAHDSPSVPLHSQLSSGGSAAVEGGKSTSSDGRHPGPSPAHKENRDKTMSSGKKRRKQATFVRSQQPFWAAIASSKITVSRELEQSHISSDTTRKGSDNTRNINKNQSAGCEKSQFHQEVWIIDIGDTEVGFCSVITPKNSQHARIDGEQSLQQDVDEEDTVAIFVRVNGAKWESISEHRSETPDQVVTQGKIYGLTPSTNYMVELVDRISGQRIYAVNLLTRSVPSLTEGSSSSPQPQQALRPSSPTTTLRKSIDAAESKLLDDRSRSKKNKKDHRSSINAVKKEVEAVEGRLASYGGNDDRKRQRQYQYRQNIRQAEDSCAEMVSEIKDLGDIPEPEKRSAEDTKKAWSRQTESHSSLRNRLGECKTEGDRRVHAAQVDSANLQQKRERIGARLQKLNAQRDNLLTSTAQNQKTQERRDQDRATLTATRKAQERDLLMNVQRFETQRHELELQASNYAEYLHVQEFGLAQQQQQIHGAGVPQTPESAFAGLASSARAMPPGFGTAVNFQQPIGTPPPFNNRRSSLLAKNRGRSSSMLSNVSGVTDVEMASTGNQPSNGVSSLMNGSSSLADGNDHTAPRHGSTGSTGSLHRFGLGSQRDSASPAAGVAAKMGPIGAGRDSPRNAKY